MLSMESRRSTTSLSLSDQGSSSAWVNLWNTNYGANPALLAAGCENDLTSAIGDKEVAAKAVAFVVNSTRRGIVPLCADVANLLRAKRSLEDRVAQLTRENELLSSGQGRPPFVARSVSLSGSTVTQPPPTTTADAARVPNSDCGSCTVTSDPVCNSPSLNDHQFQSPSLPSLNGDTQAASCSQAISQGTIIHVHQRSDSLSSCSLDSNRSLDMDPSSEAWQITVQQQLNKTIQLNNKLSEELNVAKLTIERLTKDMRAYRALYKNNNEPLKNHPSHISRQHPSPDIISSSHHGLTALPNACPQCAEMRCAYQTVPQYPQHNTSSILFNDQMQACLGDAVDTFDQKTGCIKYIGHLEGFSAVCVFIGIQLKTKVSSGTDGSINGRKYFSCSKGKGIFVMASDVARVTCKKKVTSPHPQKSNSGHSLEQSRSSSSSNSSAVGIVNKLRRAAGSLRHTNSHNRISFPSGSSTNEMAELSVSNATPPTSAAATSNGATIPSTSQTAEDLV